MILSWFYILYDSDFWHMLKAEPRQRQIALLQRCLVASSCNSGIGLSGIWENLVNLREFRSVAVFCVRGKLGKQWILSCVCWHLLCLMGCTSQGLLGDARPYLVNLPVPVQWAKLLVRASWQTHEGCKSLHEKSFKSVSITWLHVGTVRSRRFCSCLVSDRCLRCPFCHQTILKPIEFNPCCWLFCWLFWVGIQWSWDSSTWFAFQKVDVLIHYLPVLLDFPRQGNWISGHSA